MAGVGGVVGRVVEAAVPHVLLDVHDLAQHAARERRSGGERDSELINCKMHFAMLQVKSHDPTKIPPKE